MATVEIRGLTKRFGDVVAVEDLSFVARPGTVTGFLGPNGAGKTTTLRILLGLTAASAGTATIGGRPYGELDEPYQRVGAVLESSGFYPGRRARDHLRVLAAAARVLPTRVDEVLAQVGLADAAGRRVKGFSLGMRQRLGLASALLGEPDVLVLDEPASGLDPEGVRWFRRFLRSFADEGGTVLVSSHVLAEMAQTVDEVVIIAKGRLVTHSSLADLLRRSSLGVRVRTPQADVLLAGLTAQGIAVERAAPDAVVAFGTTTEAVGRAVTGMGVVVYEITVERLDLERVFLELTTTRGAIECET